MLKVNCRSNDVQNFKDRRGNRIAVFPHSQDGSTSALRVNARGKWFTLCRSEMEVADGKFGMAWTITTDGGDPFEDTFHTAAAALSDGLGAVANT